MSKFGELINSQVPVLLCFYADWNETSVAMNSVIRDVAASLGDQARVVKIDTDKNKDLCEALKIKTLPTLVIYKNSEMLWRQTGELTSDSLVNKILEFV